EIRAAVEAAVADRSVVGIVVTGEGRGFCAGLDASVLAATTEGRSEGRPAVSEAELPGLFSFFTEQPKPILAAVNGVAAGGRVRPGHEVRPALRLHPSRVHGRLQQAGPRGRARHDVAAAAPGRPR